MSNSIHSLPSLSPTTNASITTEYANLPLELILTKAKARVANYVRNTPDANGLDPFLLVIEDEYGDLVHTQGQSHLPDAIRTSSAPMVRQSTQR
jgi:hypothetical protein